MYICKNNIIYITFEIVELQNWGKNFKFVSFKISIFLFDTKNNVKIFSLTFEKAL